MIEKTWKIYSERYYVTLNVYLSLKFMYLIKGLKNSILTPAGNHSRALQLSTLSLKLSKPCKKTRSAVSS